MGCIDSRRSNQQLPVIRRTRTGGPMPEAPPLAAGVSAPPSRRKAAERHTRGPSMVAGSRPTASRTSAATVSGKFDNARARANELISTGSVCSAASTDGSNRPLT